MVWNCQNQRDVLFEGCIRVYEGYVRFCYNNNFKVVRIDFFVPESFSAGRKNFSPFLDASLKALTIFQNNEFCFK